MMIAPAAPVSVPLAGSGQDVLREHFPTEQRRRPVRWRSAVFVVGIAMIRS
jgi:hypothetical protein